MKPTIKRAAFIKISAVINMIIESEQASDKKDFIDNPSRYLESKGLELTTMELGLLSDVINNTLLSFLACPEEGEVNYLKKLQETWQAFESNK